MNTLNQNQDKESFDKAKRYSTIKYSLAIVDVIYLLALLLVFASLGISRILAQEISRLIAGRYLIIGVYFLTVYLGYYVLEFPLNLYRSFILEHKFSLSSQSLGSWLKDQAKIVALSYLIGIILLEAFYYILGRYPLVWWLVVSLFWIFFSLIMAKLMPVIIIPLFFKYSKLSDSTLRERIINLANKMKIKILDVFEIDFSRKTQKANAAFVGWGATKRIILADTLKDRYSHDEIEVILAHEFAHYRLKHLLKLILINSFATILSFYLIFITSDFVLSLFGLSSLSDIAGFPVIMIYMTVFGIVMQPFQNFISRVLERNADKVALKTTGLKEAFISMMGKLASQNLADRTPHSIIKLFFFDHPPIDERIAMARSYQ